MKRIPALIIAALALGTVVLAQQPQPAPENIDGAAPVGREDDDVRLLAARARRDQAPRLQLMKAPQAAGFQVAVGGHVEELAADHPTHAGRAGQLAHGRDHVAGVALLLGGGEAQRLGEHLVDDRRSDPLLPGASLELRLVEGRLAVAVDRAGPGTSSTTQRVCSDQDQSTPAHLTGSPPVLSLLLLAASGSVIDLVAPVLG